MTLQVPPNYFSLPCSEFCCFETWPFVEARVWLTGTTVLLHFHFQDSQCGSSISSVLLNKVAKKTDLKVESLPGVLRVSEIRMKPMKLPVRSCQQCVWRWTGFGEEQGSLLSALA